MDILGTPTQRTFPTHLTQKISSGNIRNNWRDCLTKRLHFKGSILTSKGFASQNIKQSPFHGFQEARLSLCIKTVVCQSQVPCMYGLPYYESKYLEVFYIRVVFFFFKSIKYVFLFSDVERRPIHPFSGTQQKLHTSYQL